MSAITAQNKYSDPRDFLRISDTGTARGGVVDSHQQKHSWGDPTRWKSGHDAGTKKVYYEYSVNGGPFLRTEKHPGMDWRLISSKMAMLKTDTYELQVMSIRRRQVLRGGLQNTVWLYGPSPEGPWLSSMSICRMVVDALGLPDEEALRFQNQLGPTFKGGYRFHGFELYRKHRMGKVQVTGSGGERLAAG